MSLGKVTHCYECVWDSESLDGSKACSESEGEMGKEDLVHECDEELGHVSLAKEKREKYYYIFSTVTWQRSILNQEQFA